MASLILAFLVANAVPQPQAQAILAMAHRESGYQPAAVSENFHCLLQWDHQRYRRMLWFTGTRYGCPDYRSQLSFALAELSHPQYRCFWRARTFGAAYSALMRTFGFGGSC